MDNSELSIWPLERCVTLILFTIAISNIQEAVAVTDRATLLPHHCLSRGRKLIENGHQANTGEFPYQVSLINSNFPEISICGGVIVDNKTIVTANHCVSGRHSSGIFKVVAGNVNAKSKYHVQERRVVRIYKHPKYVEVGNIAENDIAVLILRIELQFNEFVNAINLPEDDSYPSGEAVVSGWGSAGTSDLRENPYLLHFAEVPLMSQLECAAAIEMGCSYELNHNTILCSGPHDKYSYPAVVNQGDSGGGLIHDGKLIGIVSWKDEDFVVYTRVSKFVEWIRKKQEGWEASNLYRINAP